MMDGFAPDDQFMEIQQLWALCSEPSYTHGVPLNESFCDATCATVRQICREIAIIKYMDSNRGNPRFCTDEFMNCAWSAGPGAPLMVIEAAAMGFKSASLSDFIRKGLHMHATNPLFTWLFDSRFAGTSAISACTMSCDRFRAMCYTPIVICDGHNTRITLSSIFDIFARNFEDLFSRDRAHPRHWMQSIRARLLPKSMTVWYQLMHTLRGVDAKLDSQHTNANGCHYLAISSNNHLQHECLKSAFKPGENDTQFTVKACASSIDAPARKSHLPVLPNEIWDAILVLCTGQINITGLVRYATRTYTKMVRHCMTDNANYALSLDWTACMSADIQTCLRRNAYLCIKQDPFTSLAADLHICCTQEPELSHKHLTEMHRLCHAKCKVLTAVEMNGEDGLVPEVEARCKLILTSYLSWRNSNAYPS